MITILTILGIIVFIAISFTLWVTWCVNYIGRYPWDETAPQDDN
jgi:hypothetical protein